MLITPDKKLVIEPNVNRRDMSDIVTKSVGLPSAERRERMAQQARASKAERTWRAYGCAKVEFVTSGEKKHFRGSHVFRPLSLSFSSLGSNGWFQEVPLSEAFLRGDEQLT